MHILKTLHSLNPSGGGVATGVDVMARALVAMGHKVEVACFDDPNAPWLAGRPYPAYGFPSPFLRGYGWSPDFTHWLEENVRRFNAITVEGIWQYHGMAVHRAAMQARVPYFVIPQGMLDPWFRRTYPLKHLKKQLYWKLVEQHVLRDAQAVIFTAEDERLLATDSFSPWEVHGVVAAMGMAPPAGDPAVRTRDWHARFPQLRNRRCLLYLGRLDRKKGIDLLLEAYAAVHPAATRDAAPALILAGPESSPEFVATCRARARQLGLRDNQDVFWTGMLEGDWKWAAVEAADALVLPTHQDNFGFVVVEALAVGTPVLLTERVNIWREIIADDAGLAAPDTVDGVRRLLAEHAAWTPAERAKKSAAALACFANRFHLETAARRQLDILSLKA